MSYESKYERFDVVPGAEAAINVRFVRGGFLAEGDRPELFFFLVGGEETVIGLSGSSLARFERGRKRLTREQKIDVAGRWLQQQLESGFPLRPESLYIRDHELANLANELNFTE